MARVFFPKSLLPYTNGTDQTDVEARTVQELFRLLEERFPGLGKHRASLAVAIDGEIINDPLLEEVEPDSEVHFLPPISGG